MRWIACLMFLTCAAAPILADRPPNVLLIVSDDLNTDLGCYGHSLVKSPNIDRLAARGVRFERAYCQYPVCNPSRASFMTGLYPEQTRVLSNADNFRDHLPGVTTLGQMFRNQDYWSGRVGKIYHYGVPTEIGTSGMDDPASWDLVVNPRGRDKHDEDKVISIAPHRSLGGTLSWLAAEGEDSEQTDAIGATEAIALLEAQKDRPFFLAVGFYRPHTPFVAPRKYFDMYPLESIKLKEQPANDRDDIPPVALTDRQYQAELTPAQQREIIQAYYASITFMDAQVGRVLDALDRLKLADNTIVVFVSDHGYHLGHHGLWQKQDLFEGSVRVPLIIANPRNTDKKVAGQSSRALVELVDLYPTLADLTGRSAPSHLMGRSLRPVLEDPSASVRDSAYSVTTAMGKRPPGLAKGERVISRTVRTDRYRYTQWGDDGRYGEELYDYETDPDEFTNLAVAGSHAAVLDKMKSILAERRKQANAPVASGQ